MSASRVSLGAGEREAADGGVAAPTMLDLFVSGYDDVTFEEDPLNPGQEVINTKKSVRRSQAVPGAEDGIAYVPDPPCIMPFEESDEHKATKVNNVFAAIPDYWKAYAGWLEYWPKIKEHRSLMEEFRHIYENRGPHSRLRFFVNITKHSLGVRYNPVMDEDHKNGQIIAPGQCVAIEAMEEPGPGVDGGRFLKMPGPGAGWIFEYKEGQQIMAEMRNVESGMWWHRMVQDRPVEVRKAPSFSDDLRSSWIMSPQEVAVVDLKVKVFGFWFYHLFDGRGWVFQKKPGSMKNDPSPEIVVMQQCDDEFLEGDDALILKNLVPPTNEVVDVGLWTYIVNMVPVLAIGTKRNGTFIIPGSVVKVDKRSNGTGNPPNVGSNGPQNRKWLRLADGSGWVPETDERGKKLMLLQASDEVNYPSWYKPGADPNKLRENWHSGIC